MTGVDTNILIRYLAKDDEDQFRAVLKLFVPLDASFYVSDVVVMELEWVLRSRYQWTRTEIVDSLEKLLTLDFLVFHDSTRLRRAIKHMRQGADLADELIADDAQCHQCGKLASFDKSFAKRHPRLVYIPKP